MQSSGEAFGIETFDAEGYIEFGIVVFQHGTLGAIRGGRVRLNSDRCWFGAAPVPRHANAVFELIQSVAGILILDVDAFLNPIRLLIAHEELNNACEQDQTYRDRYHHFD